MKPTRILLVFGLVSASMFAFGQDFAFKVLASKGNNEIKSGDTWAPLKIGASLKLGDELKMADNSYLGLVHVSGKPLELKQAGNYEVAKLAANITGGTSVINKYTDFILSSNSPEEQKNLMKATGAVHRALEGDAISVMLPEDNANQSVYGDNAEVHWEASKSTGPYVVTLRNMFDDVLTTIETPETNATINLNDPKLADQNAILVTVSVKSDPKIVSKSYYVKRLSPEDHSNIKQSIDEMSTDVGNPTALNSLVMAAFFENHNLIIDAMGAYEEAMKLAPDVDTYKEDYDDFLLRQGLKKQ